MAGPTNISPIATRSKECARRFDQLCAIFQDNKVEKEFCISRLQILEAFGQFKVWAGNIGAFQGVQSTSSLDYRVRQVPKVSGAVVDLLEDLLAALQETCSIALGERPNRVSSPLALENVDDSVEGTTPQAEHQFQETGIKPVSEIEELFQSIPETTASLFKLSVLIRNSGSRDRYVKAQTAASKEPFDSQYDIDHVRNKFPRLDRGDVEWLKIRLGKAITLRRQFLRYCRDHHEKLARVEQEQIGPTSPMELEPELDATTIEGNEQRGTRNDEVMTFISGLTGTLAPTTATTLIPTRLEALQETEVVIDEDSRSQTSYATSGVEDDEVNHMKVIRLEEVRRAALFECPYCWSIQTVNNQRAWRKHVFQDLKPYICTYEECDLKMFPDKSTWYTHEMQTHRVQWQCCFCSHEPYLSRAAFETHTQNRHQSKYSAEQSTTLPEICQQPLDRIVASACPFCDTWEERLALANPHVQDGETLVVTPQQFRNHVGNHMEQLALFAITKEYKDDEIGESVVAARSHDSDESSKDSAVNVPVDYEAEQTPELYIAAFEGREDEVRRLVAGNARPGPDYLNGKSVWSSALSAAAAGGQTQLIQLFSEVYASPLNFKQMLDWTWPIEGSGGWAPLHWAASNGHLRSVDALLGYGANPSKHTIEGFTASQLARDHGHDAVAAVLEAAERRHEEKLKIEESVASHSPNENEIEAESRVDDPQTSLQGRLGDLNVSELPGNLPPMGPFGRGLANAEKWEGSYIPLVLVNCFKAIEKSVDKTLYLRSPGNLENTRILREKMARSPEALREETPASYYGEIWNVTSIVKHYFQSLSEPLVPPYAYWNLIDAAHTEPIETRRQHLKEVVLNLPRENSQTLEALMLHLDYVAKQPGRELMTSDKLAEIFAPLILRPPPQSSGAASWVAVDTTKIIIADAEALFKASGSSRRWIRN